MSDPNAKNRPKSLSRRRWTITVAALVTVVALVAVAVNPVPDALGSLSEIAHKERIQIGGTLANGTKLSGRWRVLEFYEDPKERPGQQFTLPSDNKRYWLKGYRPEVQEKVRIFMNESFELESSKFSNEVIVQQTPDWTSSADLLETRIYTDKNGAKILMEFNNIASEPTRIWLPLQDTWTKLKLKFSQLF
jgi:hypothetical protein